jgi:hypothetical protein
MEKSDINKRYKSARRSGLKKRSKKLKTNYKKIIQYTLWIILVALFIASVVIVIVNTKSYKR